MKNKCVENLHLAFRVDAGEKIGMGHIMRCRTIMQEWLKRGLPCSVYTKSPQIKDFLYGLDIEVCLLEEEPFTTAEAEELMERMGKKREEIVFFDSYDLNEGYISKFREKYSILLQDYDMQLYDFDMIVMPNAFLQKINYKKYEEKGICFLGGLEYQPVREEFFSNLLEAKERVKNILIMSGGTFPEKFIEMLIKAIKDENQNCSLSLIVGPYGKITDAFKESVGEIKIYQNIKNVSEIMEKNDVVISACGSTIYELMAERKPAIVYTMAENQRVIGEKLEDITGIVCCGDVREKDTIDKIILELKRLRDYDKRLGQIKKMQSVLAVNGAKNIVNQILLNI